MIKNENAINSFNERSCYSLFIIGQRCQTKSLDSSDFLVDPVDVVLDTGVDSWCVWSCTSNTVWNDTDLIDWELTIFEKWQHQWATAVTLATVFATFQESSAHNTFIEMAWCNTHLLLVQTFTIGVIDDRNLKHLQNWRLFSIFGHITPTSNKWIITNEVTATIWSAGWQTDWTNAVCELKGKKTNSINFDFMYNGKWQKYSLLNVTSLSRVKMAISLVISFSS